MFNFFSCQISVGRHLNLRDYRPYFCRSSASWPAGKTIVAVSPSPRRLARSGWSPWPVPLAQSSWCLYQSMFRPRDDSWCPGEKQSLLRSWIFLPINIWESWVDLWNYFQPEVFQFCPFSSNTLPQLRVTFAWPVSRAILKKLNL